MRESWLQSEMTVQDYSPAVTTVNVLVCEGRTLRRLRLSEDDTFYVEYGG